MAHIPTGFPKGRPRKGELRPPTPGGVWQAEYRALQKEINPNWLKIQADYQRLWHLANPGKKSAGQKKYEQREVHWKAARANGISCKMKI